MGNCDIKRVKAAKLCVGDLKHLIEIQRRKLLPSDLNTSQPVETFTTIRQQWAATETVSGVMRFAKVNIMDGATHLFWAMWDADFPDLENRNNFVFHGGRRFKVLETNNINERDTVIVIQTTERGETTEEASKA